MAGEPIRLFIPALIKIQVLIKPAYPFTNRFTIKTTMQFRLLNYVLIYK